jgi:hypothetical protein
VEAADAEDGKAATAIRLLTKHQPVRELRFATGFFDFSFQIADWNGTALYRAVPFIAD